MTKIDLIISCLITAVLCGGLGFVIGYLKGYSDEQRDFFKPPFEDKVCNFKNCYKPCSSISGYCNKHKDVNSLD